MAKHWINRNWYLAFYESRSTMAVKVYNDIFLENDEILNRFSLLGGGAFKQMNKEDNDYGGFILSGGKAPAPAPWKLNF